MSNVSEMPELLDFLGIAQTTQVIHNDKAKWLLKALNEALEAAAAKSVKYRKKSTISLKIQLHPGQMNQMTIEASLEVAEPKADIIPMMAYTDSRGRLFGEDPAQTRLPLENTVELRKDYQ